MKIRTLSAGLALAGVLVVTGCAVLDPHSTLTIDHVITSNQENPDSPFVTTNAREITEEVCGDELDCVEVWSTDEADYLRFASRARATEYAASLDDGFVSHFIVMDFAGKTADPQAQFWAMEGLDGTWQDPKGDYPARG